MADPEEQFDDLHWEIIDILREGRVTPSYLSQRTGESRQLVSQRLRDLRLAGLVEKVHKGLYELDEDPRGSSGTDVPAQTEGDGEDTTDVSDNTQEAGSDQSHLAGTPPEASESGVAAFLEGVEFPGTKDRAECVEAVQAAHDYIEREGSATMREFVRQVMPEHPIGYTIPELQKGERYRGAWWRKVVKPGLEALPDVEAPPQGASDWRYTGEGDLIRETGVF